MSPDHANPDKYTDEEDIYMDAMSEISQPDLIPDLLQPDEDSDEEDDEDGS